MHGRAVEVRQTELRRDISRLLHVVKDDNMTLGDARLRLEGDQKEDSLRSPVSGSHMVVVASCLLRVGLHFTLSCSWTSHFLLVT
jgi:hypothetical protein